MIFDNFRKRTKEPTIEDVMCSVPEIPLSEEMTSRDNFFPSCWINLKKERQNC